MSPFCDSCVNGFSAWNISFELLRSTCRVWNERISMLGPPNHCDANRGESSHSVSKLLFIRHVLSFSQPKIVKNKKQIVQYRNNSIDDKRRRPRPRIIMSVSQHFCWNRWNRIWFSSVRLKQSRNTDYRVSRAHRRRLINGPSKNKRTTRRLGGLGGRPRRNVRKSARRTQNRRKSNAAGW